MEPGKHVPANATDDATTLNEMVRPATTQLTEIEDPDNFAVFSSKSNFETAQRMAKMLNSSDLVPENFRGPQNLGNAVIALELSNRIGASPLAIMQNLYIVHGRPAWSSQFLIACINACGRFTPLRYVVTKPEEAREVNYSYTVYVKGEKQRKEGTCRVANQTCYAWAVDKTGERLESPVISIDMAVAEGWYTKNDSKWRTMPELMLRYRAATLFARLYAPELTMGIKTDDEVIDITPVVTERTAPPKWQPFGFDKEQIITPEPVTAADTAAPPASTIPSSGGEAPAVAAGAATATGMQEKAKETTNPVPAATTPAPASPATRPTPSPTPGAAPSATAPATPPLATGPVTGAADDKPGREPTPPATGWKDPALVGWWAKIVAQGVDGDTLRDFMTTHKAIQGGDLTLVLTSWYHRITSDSAKFAKLIKAWAAGGGK